MEDGKNDKIPSEILEHLKILQQQKMTRPSGPPGVGGCWFGINKATTREKEIIKEAQKKSPDLSFKGLIDPEAGVSIAHLNSESLANIHQDMTSFLRDNNLDIFALSDISVYSRNEHTNSYEIQNYFLHRLDQPNSSRGSFLYVKSDFSSEILDIPQEIQSLFKSCLVLKVMSMSRHLKRPLIITVLEASFENRHNSKAGEETSLFLDAFQSFCEWMNKNHQNVDLCILGDFNNHLLNTVKNSAGVGLKKMAEEFKLVQVIKEASRRALPYLNRADPFFVNFLERVRQSGIFELSPNCVNRAVFIVM